jgi:hypothetical protein
VTRDICDARNNGERTVLEKIADVPDGIDALKAVGTVTKEDYEGTVEPILDEARRRGRRIRLLVQLGPEYEGFTAGMAWEKAATGLRSFSTIRLFDGYAIVSDAKWILEWTHLVGFLLPFPLLSSLPKRCRPNPPPPARAWGYRGRGQRTVARSRLRRVGRNRAEMAGNA